MEQACVRVNKQTQLHKNPLLIRFTDDMHIFNGTEQRSGVHISRGLNYMYNVQVKKEFKKYV